MDLETTLGTGREESEFPFRVDPIVGQAALDVLSKIRASTRRRTTSLQHILEQSPRREALPRILRYVGSRFLRESEKHAGFTFVLGYNPAIHHDSYFQLKRNRVEFPLNITDPSAYDFFKRLALDDDDGGVHITRTGDILRTGIHIIYDSKKFLDTYQIVIKETLGKSLGFEEEVGERHISGKMGSDFLKDTTILVLSSQFGTIRGFEDGETKYTPYEMEKTNDPVRNYRRSH
jgi:hypothetical protein